MKSHSHHRFGHTAACDPGTELTIEAPRDEERDRDRQEDEPLPPSECAVESTERVVGELDGPDEDGAADSD